MELKISNKFSIFKSENIVSKAQIDAHFLKSKLVLEEQISHFQNKIILNQKSIKGNKKEQNKVLKKLSLHQSPWDVYKNQLDVLISQFNLIENNQIALKTTVSAFDSLKNVVASLKGNYENLETQLLDSITNILSHHASDKKHKELTFFIEEQLVKTASLGNNQLVFTEDLNENISQLQKIKAPITSQNGLLTIREMDLGKTAHKWFDYQILPDFMDLVEIENSLKNLYSICLNNLKNSLQLDKSTQNSEINYTQIIANLQSDLSELGIKGKQTIIRIINNSNEQLRVSNFIKGQPFLEVPFNSSLHFKSDNLLNSIKLPIQKGVNFFNSQFIKSAKYNAFPNVELATECLTYRMYKETNDHYDALFLNKKFIVDVNLKNLSFDNKELKISQ